MSHLIVSDDALVLQLGLLVSQFGATAPVMRLFSNNVTITTSTVIGDFTESAFTGYTQVSLGTWSGASVSSHVAFTSPTNAVFTFSTGTPDDVRGFYITDASATVWYYAQTDPAGPITMNVDGQSYTVNLTLTDESKFSS